jgi:hypothetical protein
MITVSSILSMEQEGLQEASKQIQEEDIPQLVEWLSEKDDKIRYPSFLLLRARSEFAQDVYPYWDIFCEKLKSDNSFQRNIGLILLAENARWDTGNKLDLVIDDYLMLLKDEKPITVRQCVQALDKIVPYKPQLLDKIAERLMALELTEIRETMRKLVLTDILQILLLIRKQRPVKSIEAYIGNALTGGILDKKAKKQLEELL